MTPPTVVCMPVRLVAETVSVCGTEAENLRIHLKYSFYFLSFTIARNTKIFINLSDKLIRNGRKLNCWYLSIDNMCSPGLCWLPLEFCFDVIYFRLLTKPLVLLNTGQEVLPALGVCYVFDTYVDPFGMILPRTLLFTMTPKACAVTLNTLPVFP
ncbi:hypothetical protein NQ317_006052 [Molorchus minor]|uniref:Uncharacterized protein n=1 Tax=Molorchus minor TaxID=1323400 RepID=A0ABQ9K4Z9_9CUCU|nr:hypothetical protein NQ317_006052 [Molorchus minor]